jgi:hypothetical protein
MSTRSRLVVLGLMCATLLASPAPAQEGNAATSPTDLRIEELNRALGVRDQVIRNLITRIEQLESAVNALEGVRPAAAAAQAAPVAAPVAVPVAASFPAAQDQQLIRAAFERTLIDRGGLLLPPGKLEFEPSLSYAHSSSENLVIDGFTIFPVLVIGDIVSERLRRDTMTASLSARLGLPWRSQLEVRLPWIAEDSSRLLGDGEEIRIRDQGPGDFEIALSRDLPLLFGRGPQLLGSVRWKSTTARDPFGLDEETQIPFGTGFQSLTASVTGVSVLDPAVFFSTLSYTHTYAATRDGNRIAPGRRYGLQMGMALALNLETSLSLGFEQSFSRRTRFNYEVVPGTYVNSGTLSLGLSRAFPSGRSFNTTLAIGMSEDSPDLQLAFSTPFR